MYCDVRCAGGQTSSATWEEGLGGDGDMAGGDADVGRRGARNVRCAKGTESGSESGRESGSDSGSGGGSGGETGGSGTGSDGEAEYVGSSARRGGGCAAVGEEARGESAPDGLTGDGGYDAGGEQETVRLARDVALQGLATVAGGGGGRAARREMASGETRYLLAGVREQAKGGGEDGLAYVHQLEALVEGLVDGILGVIAGGRGGEGAVDGGSIGGSGSGEGIGDVVVEKNSVEELEVGRQGGGGGSSNDGEGGRTD